MAGVDEGDDVGPHVRVGNSAPILRVLRRHEQGQEIARRLGAVRQQRPSLVDDRIDGGIEKFERVPAAPASQSRQKRGRAQQIERIDPADGLEIARHRALKGARLAPEPLREQRLLEHRQRHPRHGLADVRHGAVATAGHALDRRLPDPMDGGSEFRDLTRREQGRERAALEAPVLALGGQEPVAESRPQDAKLKIVLAVVRGVVEKNAPDRGRIMRRAAQAEDGAADRDRPFEIPLPPDFDRIALDGEEGRERTPRPVGPARIGRNEELRGC